MRKEGQIQMSFTMIFSIIIIIATVALAFYFIQKFLETGECVSTRLFKKDLQDSIDRVWRAPAQSQQPFTQKLPSGVKQVCFGDYRDAEAYPDIQEQYALYARDGDNFFIYPAEKACGGSVARQEILHLSLTNHSFFCIPAEDGKITMTLSKRSSTDAFVYVST
ncbi:hypothetical protein HYZ97_02920 [Candidatus Pacearchaeota archaeon]|nr:hypothetical protein [Candidatus Pacearchaeota archaeon]